MAGIYIHIPWCRKVCIYCDFHFSVSMRNKEALIECMGKEIELQKNYLANETVESIYFGGGTPSVLSSAELSGLLDRIKELFDLSDNTEITLEANPDDMSVEYLKELRSLGVNRLSIGIQSFFDDDLQWMNRRHNREISIGSVKNSRQAGFDNISIDLIYGIPGMDSAKWLENLKIAFQSKPEHISAYHLTLENKTVYAHRIKKGLMQEPDEAAGLEHFEMLMDMAGEHGYLHYEISNFSLPGFISRHNTSYWLQKPYLGIGPSANSYNRKSRQWNVRNNSEYIREINKGIIPCGYEELNQNDHYNEYILTSLRTSGGTDSRKIKQDFGQVYHNHFLKESQSLLNEGKIEKQGDRIVLSRRGKFFADGIISGLFMV